jgi:hypothetical protein
MRNWKPIFIENSRVPVWLSKVAPLNIGAITMFFVVFARGEVDDTTRRHETIHFQQTLEMFLFGMIIVYVWDYLYGLIRYFHNWQGQLSIRGHEFTSAANKAYHRIRAEQEAYMAEDDPEYLSIGRRRYAWLIDYEV